MKPGAVFVISAALILKVSAQYTFAFYRDAGICIQFDDDISGSGNRECETTDADTDVDTVMITGISGTGCVVYFYEGDDCNEDDDPDMNEESFDEGMHNRHPFLDSN